MDGQLTGRVGYRRGLFGRLIPQVEVLKVARPLRAPPPPGVKRKPEVYAVWRDAVAADVLALGQMVGCTAHKLLARSPRTPAVEVE
jgi:hypothetical protein